MKMTNGGVERCSTTPRQLSLVDLSTAHEVSKREKVDRRSKVDTTETDLRLWHVIEIGRKFRL